MFAQVYKAEHPKLALKVYCLKYEASLETDRYISALQQEQAAFENLIASKGHMVSARLLSSSMFQFICSSKDRRLPELWHCVPAQYQPEQAHPFSCVSVQSAPQTATAWVSLTAGRGCRRHKTCTLESTCGHTLSAIASIPAAEAQHITRPCYLDRFTSLLGLQVLPDLSSELLALQQAPTTAPLALTHPGVEQDFLPGTSATNNAITRHGGAGTRLRTPGTIIASLGWCQLPHAQGRLPRRAVL